MTPTIAFRLTGPASQEDLATALLFERGTLGIDVGEAPGGLVTLLAYFPAGLLTLGSLAACFEQLPEVRVEAAAVPEVDWVARFRQGFRPFTAGGFRVVPAWDPGSPEARRLVVDPGRAFGTGSHESTRLCLQALQDVASRRDLGRVLDVGCGTGILGVAAARLGAATVVCVDLDAEAVASAALHARLNGVGLRILRGDGCRAIAAAFDVVTANIAAATLVERRDDLVGALAPGGALILSGILSADVDAVGGAYAGLGAADLLSEGEWAALLLRRPAA